MIKTFEKVADGNYPCNWWDDVEQLKTIGKIEFGPSLNIIIGPNGSGKSTFIKTMAKMFYCEQGGLPTLTQSAMMPMFPIGKDSYAGDSFKIEHDGSLVYYFNPSNVVGIDGGHHDDDFFMEGLANRLDPESSGRNDLRGFLRIMDIAGSKDAEVDDRLGGKCNDLWQERIDTVKVFLGEMPKKVRPCVIMDEPERSFDLVERLYFWNFIAHKLPPEMQIIICSHSSLSLDVEGATYIETEKGYREKCLKTFKEFMI